jgi:hypothetical protein
MRYLLLLALALCVNSRANSQEKTDFVYFGTKVELSKKLLNAYSVDHLQQLEDSNPDLLLYLNYFVDHSYELMDRQSFQKPLANISALTLSKKFDQKFNLPNEFEILKYDLILKPEAQYFEIDSKRMVMVKPQKLFIDNFNQYKNKLKN